MRLLEWVLGALVVLAALVSRRPTRPLPPGVDAEDLAAGYERSDANVRGIALGGLALLVALGLVLVAVSWLEASVTGIPVTVGRPTDLVDRLAGAPTPPPPRLETAEGAQFDAYRATAEQRQRSYAWVDRGAGTVSIPIERAKDLVAQRGLPSAQSTPSATDDGRRLPSRASSGRVSEVVWP